MKHGRLKDCQWGSWRRPSARSRDSARSGNACVELAPPLLSLLFCVTLTESLNISGSQFPYLINGGHRLANLTTLLLSFSVPLDEKFSPVG